jgi:hypothetical protein
MHLRTIGFFHIEFVEICDPDMTRLEAGVDSIQAT